MFVFILLGLQSLCLLIESHWQVQEFDYQDFKWNGTNCAMIGPTGTVCSGKWVQYYSLGKCIEGKSYRGRPFQDLSEEKYTWTCSQYKWDWIKLNYKGRLLCGESSGDKWVEYLVNSESSTSPSISTSSKPIEVEVKIVTPDETKAEISKGRQHPVQNKKVLRDASVKPLTFTDMKGTCNIPEQKTLRDEPGPVADRAGAIFLKGYHPVDLEKITAWMAILGSGNYKYVTHECEMTDRINAQFVNSSYFLEIMELKCKIPTTIRVTVPGFQKSEIIVEKNDLKHSCSSGNSIIEYFNIGISRFNSYRSFEVCFNGTILESDQILEDRVNCTMVYLNKYFSSCPKINSNCEIKDSYKLEESGKFIIDLTLSIPGTILIRSDKRTERHYCEKECTIKTNIDNHVRIVCPDGSEKTFHVISENTKDCFLLNYWISSRIAASLCRMSYDANQMVIFLVWVLVGYVVMHVLMILLDALLSAVTWCFSKCKNRLGINYHHCSVCEEQFVYDSMIEYHESCSLCVCPYCRITMKDLHHLKKHVLKCNMKADKMDSVRRRDVKDWRAERAFETLRRQTTKKYIPKVGYVLIAIVLFFMVITPTKAFSDVQDSWEEFKKELIDCGTECWRTTDTCECPSKEYKGSRVLLNIDKSPNARTFGYLNINNTFHVANNERVVDLTFNSVIKGNKNFLVSGNSIANLPLEIGTGIIWKMGTEDSPEKKTLSLGVYDYSQIYSSVFRYSTLDRTIKKTSSLKCTGECSTNCDCESRTCKSLKLEKDRGWSCNPGWCWSSGTGCTCCSLFASHENIKYIASFWELQYEKTDLVLCINYDHPKYTCFPATSGGSFNIDNFNIKVTKVFGIDRKLPKNVVTFHEKHLNGFNLEDPDYMSLDPSTKGLNGIQHGEVGDYSFTNTIELFKGKNSDEAKAGVQMKWTGVSIDRTCATAQGPSCIYSGVAEDISYEFKNMIDTNEEIHTNYIIQTLKVNPSQNNLNCKVRPKKGAGMVEVVLKVRNLELRRKKETLEIKLFRLENCKGCRGCHLGFWCEVRISLKTPDSHALHLVSYDKNFVVESSSVIARSSVETYNISLYTPIKSTSVTICIQEAPICSTFNKLNLSEPIKTLIARKEQLVNSGIEKILDSHWYSRMWSGTKAFFGGIWNLISTIFTSWQTILIFIVIIIILIIIVKLKIFRLLLCFIPKTIAKKMKVISYISAAEAKKSLRRRSVISEGQKKQQQLSRNGEDLELITLLNEGERKTRSAVSRM